MPGAEVGIDLGTSMTRIFMRGRGEVLCEPSVAAVDVKTGTLRTVGKKAQDMLDRTHPGLRVVRPIKNGVVSEYDLTQRMLSVFLQQGLGYKFFKPRVLACVSKVATGVERKALVKVFLSAGARGVILVEKPVLAALGAGIDISAPYGRMIVDIGAGTTEIAVLSLHGISVSQSLKMGGDDFDQAIQKYIRRKYGLFIGLRTAERLKKEIGCAYPQSDLPTAVAKGRGAITGLPSSAMVTAEDIRSAIAEKAATIVHTVQSVLAATPPELIGDLYNQHIVLTGGGSQLRGIDRLVEDGTGIAVRLPEDPAGCVPRGAGKALKNSRVAVQSGRDYRYLFREAERELL